MKFGVLSVAFGSLPVAVLADRIKGAGFDKIHLEPKHIKELSGLRPGQMSAGLASFVTESFSQRGIRIPALGCYTNLIDVDEERREFGIKLLIDHLRFAREFGASLVSTETGTANTESPWEHHPDNQSEANWRLLKNVVCRLAEEAEKWGVYLALEGYTNNVIHTPERMHRMLGEVGSSHVGVVMDPCNYVDKTHIGQQDEIMRTTFELLGDRILMAHAKDFRLDEEGRMTQPAAGTGGLNYELYLRLLHQSKPFVHLFVEHLREDQMRDAIQFLERKSAQVGAYGSEQ